MLTHTTRPMVALAAGLLLTAGCATSTPLPTLASPETSVVLGTAIIAPDRIVPLVTEAVRLDPRSAEAVAAAAAAGAPDQALAIRDAVIREAPAARDRVVAVTTVKRREPAVTRVEIPRYERVAMLVEDADQRAGNVQIEESAPRITSQGVGRLGTGLARTLGNLGRSVIQFVEDLR